MLLKQRVVLLLELVDSGSEGNTLLFEVLGVLAYLGLKPLVLFLKVAAVFLLLLILSLDVP